MKSPLGHRRSETSGDYVDEDVFEEDYDYDEEEDEDEGMPGRNIHIHLESLLGLDVLNYLVENVPWHDLLGGNKLSRTEEVRYVSEHMVEEGDEDEEKTNLGE